MAVRIKELEEENQKLHEQLLNKSITETIKFDVVNHIGSGRYGKTYKILFENKVRAAKLLHRKLLNSSQSTENITAELDARCHLCLGLHHPNLVEFIRITKVENEVAVITELMTMNLCTYINEQNGKPFSLDLQVSLCMDISQGLQELHRFSVFCLNLHDTNILIKDDQAKISDFYYPLLQLKGDNQDYADTVMPHVPPEGFKSRQSDIYSLGVLFTQIVTSITKKTALQQIVDTIMKKLTSKELLVPSIIQNHILMRLIEQCLNVESRPSIANICESIKIEKESPQYISYRALNEKVSYG